MPKGLKPTSSQIVVSFETREDVAGTFKEQRIDLQLNALDNEVFVVTGVNMDLTDPILGLADPVANFPSNTRFTRASLSKQSIVGSTTQGLGNPSVFATSTKSFQIQNTTTVATNENLMPIVPFIEAATEAPYDVEYLDIVATPDFYVGILSDGAAGQQGSVQGKLYGYRARADSSTYAALVQSELLSQ